MKAKPPVVRRCPARQNGKLRFVASGGGTECYTCIACGARVNDGGFGMEMMRNKK